ncbi:hypothetical protein EGP64_00350 [bacterium]|nr:hypothetical protein [bacterium]
MSRMDRYYKNETLSSGKRTARNQELYNKIYEDSEYSNIEGIATIEKNNEVDITKIKNMLKNREDFPSQKEFRNYSPKEIKEPTYEKFDQEEDRVYDIRDILNKAKTNKTEEKYQSIQDFNLDYLRKMKETKKESNLGLGEMVDTITNTSKLNKLSDHELGLDMFEDLKSKENTIIEGKDSIRSILEEAKKNDLKKQENTSANLDKSFFTSSMNFTDDDFEQIVELNKQMKKNSITIKILIFVVITVIAIGTILLVFHFLK